MLQCLERMDEAENAIAAKRDEHLRLSEHIEKERVMIKQETRQGEKKLARLDEDWNRVSYMVKPELMEKYNMIKKQQGKEIAVVPVKNAVCYGCNVNLPPQMYNELQRRDSLKFCPNCERIIYWEES